MPMSSGSSIVGSGEKTLMKSKYLASNKAIRAYQAGCIDFFDMEEAT